MNNQHQLALYKLAEQEAAAADVIRLLFTSAELSETVLDANLEELERFCAFLLVSEVRGIAVERMLEACRAAYCLTAETRESAYEALRAHRGWDRLVSELHEELGVADLLHWDDTALRRVLHERYAFVNTYDGCRVFDLEAIAKFIEN